MTALVGPSGRRLAVNIRAAALRQVGDGHPWIYDGSIDRTSFDARPGDVAVVFDGRDRFAAVGLWDPTSPIRLRILHAGSPRTLDRELVAERLADAAARRDELRRDGATTGYRWCNGESDALPGVVVDRYDRTVVLRLDTIAWVPHLDVLVDVLTATDEVERVVLRTSRLVAAALDDGHLHPAPTVRDGDVLAGPPVAGPIEFLEAGLRFGADVIAGQKTGHFLDQRDNRIAVGRAARGAEVLDLCCATGGFSVHAAAGGATSVVSVDQAPEMLAATRANLERNASATSATFAEQRRGDVFAVVDDLHRRGHRFDVVVIDPPSFAPRASAVDAALRAYERLTVLGVGVSRPGGLVVQSSCSSRVDAATFHARVLAAGRSTGRDVIEVDRTGHALDHPATIPEAHYLKTSYLRVAS